MVEAQIKIYNVDNTHTSQQLAQNPGPVRRCSTEGGTGHALRKVGNSDGNRDGGVDGNEDKDGNRDDNRDERGG